MTERYALKATDRVTPLPGSSAVTGRVAWAPVKSIWFSAMALGGVAGVIFFPSWQAAGVTLMLMLLTLCLGHSVGMHRLLIHRSFSAPLWLEYTLVYLGTLVGMAGPIGMFHIHEIRDWQQQQPDCHPFAKHTVGFWHDAMWQMHCEQRLDHPPALQIEDRVTRDPFYRWLAATWRWQQLPVAVLLFELPPEIRTLTKAAICCLLIFNTKEVRNVETKATSSRIQGQSSVRSAERRRDGQRVGQSVWRASHDDPSMEAGSS